ncbi:MAG: C-terminal binding protein [Thermomicrobiales bacterium]|nr:C-terminal binding protein [Thermomicrobiales bacterium]
MTVQVFQVDSSPRLLPYAYETDAIREAGGEFVVASCTAEAEIIDQGRDAEIMLVSWSKMVTPAVMDALPRLRLIARWGVGYDMIDVEAATERGIAVVNTPTYCGDEVAEHAIALLFAVARRVVWAHERMRNGEYVFPPHSIHRLSGSTLGIIGCGRIGSKVAKRALGLGMNVIAYDKYRPDEELRALGVEPRSFDDVLGTADYITLHTPLGPGTRHLIDAAALAKIRPEAMLINTSRGGVIEQTALVDALANGRLAAAGLDVFEREPLPADSPLRRLEHVVLTPHTAAFSEESIELLRQEMVENVAEWIATGWNHKIVNPEVREHLRARI